MMNKSNINVKVADQPWELEEVSRLNHQTFSEEIQQHEKTSTGLLIDKFHEENQYVICQYGAEIVGMLALRDIRPFSLDFKLENIDDYLPPHTSLCEIRLLTVKPKYRRSRIFYYLIKEVFNQFTRKHYDFALISGILSQQKLYRSIGFVPFGPLVGDSVKFQPMYSSIDFFLKSRHHTIELTHQNKRINALSGPVDIKPVVAAEYDQVPESHRSEDFVQKYKSICAALCDSVNASNAQIFTGSGTLANEIILAHLYGLSKHGLIASNGEFGNRIIHQAHCQKLIFSEYKTDLGEEFNIHHVEHLMDEHPDIKWFFFVHCETSTGVLNDFSEIVNLCRQRNILVLVDCVSTFGIVPLDLSKVYMASASSGKAIGSFSGLSMVFFNDLQNIIEKAIPVYLNIWHYIKKNGIPFTLSSNALYALGTAVEIADIDSKYEKTIEKTSWLRKQISEQCSHLHLLNGKALHPAIITITLQIGRAHV